MIESSPREAAGHSSGSGSAALSLRYPGRKSQDVFLQLVDLEEGVYGEPFTIALYLHVSTIPMGATIHDVH